MSMIDVAAVEASATTRPPITAGMEVTGREGCLGWVRDVLPSWNTTSPTHIVVETNTANLSTVIVPLHWATAISPTRITLRARQRHLARRPILRPDSELAEEIRTALTAAPSFQQPDALAAMEVVVEGCVAYLRGNTRSMLQVLDADLLAAQVRGVVEVRNELISDDEIEQAVERDLRQAPSLPITDLWVKSRLGVVRVGGRVRCAEQCAHALLLARQVAGVRSVVNEVTVEPEPKDNPTTTVVPPQILSMGWCRPAPGTGHP